jgi:glycosyltransferase involved in cell wall biosynthesis
MLKEAIASAKAQNWPCEIIVVNDGSSDETVRVLDAMEDIHVLHQENSGKPSALNAGLAVAKGEAVLVLDDDDLLMPGAVNVLAHGLFSNPRLVAVFGDAILFSDETQEKAYWPGLRYPGEMLSTAVLQQIPAATGATLVRMSAQRQVGDYDLRLKRGEDMDMFLRLSQLGPMESVPLPTFLLRDHNGLRGAQGDQWSKKDPEMERAKLLSYAKPVFRERWQQYSGLANRQESHGWALGLWERDLREEAVEEVSRWSAPYGPSEIWIRKRLGLVSEAAKPSEALLVVDDGDEGALEDCLLRYGANRAVFVDLEVPRDPFGSIRLHWEGCYVARRRLNSEWIDHDGPVVLRISSDPGWSPPPLSDLIWLPDVPAMEAVRAYAHIVGWPEPLAMRKGLDTPSTPLLGELRACRAHSDSGHHLRAIAALREVLRLQPDWLGAWWLAAEVFERAGMGDRAECFRSRLLSLQAKRRAACVTG